jgi:AraC-like DNA-binding protein
MFCLELLIPPLPQLITIGHFAPSEGNSHFERNFALYDIIIVKSGSYYMSEEGTPYEINSNSLLVLEPNKRHWGHQGCPQGTDLYYLHLLHGAPLRSLEEENIQWNTLFHSPTRMDEKPSEQRIYLPKFTAILDPAPLFSLLDRMVEMKNVFTLENQLSLQVMLGQLLIMLQNGLRTRTYSESHKLSKLIISYLQAHSDKPFRLEDLSKEFHFHVDYISKSLKKHTGLTPLQMSHRIKIEKAKSTLQHTNQPIKEIVSQLGFSDYNYFLRLFRQQVGLPPAAFRSTYFRHK